MDDIFGPIGWSDIETVPKINGHPVLLGHWTPTSAEIAATHNGGGWGWVIMAVWVDEGTGWAKFNETNNEPEGLRPRTPPTHWKPMDAPDGTDYKVNYSRKKNT